MPTTLELKFHDEMRQLYDRSAKYKYYPKEFRKMVAETGGLPTAQKLLATAEPSPGFADLIMIGHLELSMEALVLQKEFWPLFTQQELDTAWKRLGDVGYLSTHPMERPVKNGNAEEVGPENPLSVIEQRHMDAAMEELRSGQVNHPYKEPTKYVHREGDRTYAPKAIVGVAFRIATGDYPTYLSGGEAHANRICRKFGYEVEPIDPDVIETEDVDERAGKDWTSDEVQLVVEDYFDMLRDELADKPINKTDHRKKLHAAGLRRSHGSIELKHQNISAILIRMGLPYIDGYKPRGNFQGLLADTITVFVEDHPELFEQIEHSPKTQVEPKIVVPNLTTIIETPPTDLIFPEPSEFNWKKRKGICPPDYPKRDAENKKLGDLGEQYILGGERKRLNEAGRDDLAKKVQWIARDFKDGAGFDILSFNEQNDREKMIEVKTTVWGKDWPFYLTANEIRCSEANAANYNLYRLFAFKEDPKLYILDGDLNKACKLQATQYRALPLR